MNVLCDKREINNMCVCDCIFSIVKVSTENYRNVLVVMSKCYVSYER